MQKNSKPSIAENIRLLLMFKAFKDIRTAIENEDEQKRKDRRLAKIVITLAIIILCVLILSISFHGKKQETHILGLHFEPGIQAENSKYL